MWTGLVALVLASVAARRVFGGYPPRPRGAVLSCRELACVEAVAEAVFPPGGAIEVSGVEADVAGYVDRLVAASWRRQRVLLRLLLFAFEHATLLFPAPGGWRGLRRFSGLDPGQRSAVLESWRTSSLFTRRLFFTSQRALVTMGYLADGRVLRRLDLVPYAIDTPLCEADLLYPPIGHSRSEIDLGPEDVAPSRDARPLAPGDPRLREAASGAP